MFIQEQNLRLPAKQNKIRSARRSGSPCSALTARAQSQCRRGQLRWRAPSPRGAAGIGAGRPGREELPAPRTARPGLGALPAGGRRRAGQGRAGRRGWDLHRVIPPGGGGPLSEHPPVPGAGRGEPPPPASSV